MDNVVQTLLARQLHGVDSRVMVLHPRYNAQKWLASPFFNEPNMIYVRFGSASSSEDMDMAYGHALASQWDGRPLSDLKLIIMDEYDRINDSLSVRLVQAILRETTARILIFSRSMPGHLLSDTIVSAQAKLAPCSTELMLTEFSRSRSMPLLEVQALCAGRVYVNGHLIEQWDGALPRALFFYLVDRGMVTRKQIFDTFWPKLNIREATNVFHVTKRKINEVLGFDLMSYSAGFYRVSEDIELRYDVNLFLEWIQESAVTASERAAELLNQAIALYRCDFLGVLGDEFAWVRERREQLRQTYGDALGALGHWRIQQGESDFALHLFGRASSIHPHREDLVDQMMRLYRDRGKPEHGLMVYQRLQTELQRRLNIQPARSLQELAREMGAGE